MRVGCQPKRLKACAVRCGDRLDQERGTAQRTKDFKHHVVARQERSPRLGETLPPSDGIVAMLVVGIEQRQEG